jgi:hypothetical protein
VACQTSCRRLDRSRYEYLPFALQVGYSRTQRLHLPCSFKSQPGAIVVACLECPCAILVDVRYLAGDLIQ